MACLVQQSMPMYLVYFMILEFLEKNKVLKEGIFYIKEVNISRAM